MGLYHGNISISPVIYAKSSGDELTKKILEDNFETLVIPNNITTIRDNAFSYSQSLKNLTIPDSVTSIGNRAFCNCSNLTDCTILSNSITSLPFAFYYCTNLANITIVEGVTNLYETFWQCYNLFNAPVIPNSVTDLYFTFYACPFTTAPEIPSSAINIGSTFSYCPNLTGDIIVHSENVTNARYFASCSDTLLKNIYIPFTYSNGVYTTTYNTFKSNGYSDTKRDYCNAMIFDIKTL